MLPREPLLLVSILNTKLRDVYNSLEALCDDLDESIEEICAILNENGYVYDPNLNQFKEIL